MKNIIGMGRPVKYQAYDHDNKRMVDVKAIDWDENGNVVSINYPHGKLYPDKEFGHRISLRQFTGLKDKQGIEAYQDDIYRPWGDDRIYRIVWDNDNAGFSLLQTNGNKWPCNMMMIPYSEGGIIGNIYENLDLITLNTSRELE